MVARRGGVPCSSLLLILRDSLSLTGHCVSTLHQLCGLRAFLPSFLWQCPKVVVTVRIMGVCWSVSINFPLIIIIVVLPAVSASVRSVQESSFADSIFPESNKLSNTSLFSFSDSFALDCFFFLFLFYAATTRFLVLTSPTSSTNLSACFRCLFALSARAVHLSASFVSDAFLAARSDWVLRVGALQAGVLQMLRALRRL